MFFFKQKTAYEMRISDWSSDVCSSDLRKGVTLSRPRNAEMEKLMRKKRSEKVRLIWPTRSRPQPLRKIAISRQPRAILSQISSCAAGTCGAAADAGPCGAGLARIVTALEAAPRAVPAQTPFGAGHGAIPARDRKSTRLNSSH